MQIQTHTAKKSTMVTYSPDYYYTRPGLSQHADNNAGEILAQFQNGDNFHSEIRNLIDLQSFNQMSEGDQFWNLRFVFVVLNIATETEREQFFFESYNNNYDDAQMVAWASHYNIEQDQWHSFLAWQMAQLFNLYREQSQYFEGNHTPPGATIAGFVSKYNLNNGIDLAHIDDQRFGFLFLLYQHQEELDLAQLSFDTFQSSRRHDDENFHYWQEYQFNKGHAAKKSKVQPIIKQEEEEKEDETDFFCSEADAESIVQLILKVERNQRDLDKIQITVSKPENLFGDGGEGY